VRVFKGLGTKNCTFSPAPAVRSGQGIESPAARNSKPSARKSKPRARK
jgi:hypothetical protein